MVGAIFSLMFPETPWFQKKAAIRYANYSAAKQRTPVDKLMDLGLEGRPDPWPSSGCPGGGGGAGPEGSGPRGC